MTQAATATAVAPSVAPVLAEFREESAITRRCLERVPADKLTWKPHATSLSLGQLAFHIAKLPGAFATALVHDSFEPGPEAFTFPAPKDAAEILSTYEQGVAAGSEFLAHLSDAYASGDWTVLSHGEPMIVLPRAKAIRMWMLNHCVHHRGQLTVYFRELGIPVPSIYGPSGDENPLAPKA